MSIIAKNTSNSDITIGGQVISANGQYTLQYADMASWSTSDLLVAKLGTGEIVINDGIQDLSANDGIRYVQGSYPKVMQNSPFTSKVIDGKKLYKRVHGVKVEVLSGQTADIEFVVPYNFCKINAVDIVGGNIGDVCDFEVYDTPTGTISGYPNILLNQFGFAVNIAKDFYREESSYDADLIKDMKLEVHYTNNSANTVTVGVNFILHELKS